MRILLLMIAGTLVPFTASRDVTRQSVQSTGACAAASPRASAFAVVERRAPNDTLATVTICLVSDTAKLRLAGYHGELTLGGNGRIVKVHRPSGGTRIENTTVPGRVSFAGVAAEGLASGPVLALTVARLSSNDDARVRLTMIDVTDIAGRDVAKQVQVDSMPRSARAP